MVQQNIMPAQFQIVLETNACLRKIAEPLCADKISEENIKQAFDLRTGRCLDAAGVSVRAWPARERDGTVEVLA